MRATKFNMCYRFSIITQDVRIRRKIHYKNDIKIHLFAADIFEHVNIGLIISNFQSFLLLKCNAWYNIL